MSSLMDKLKKNSHIKESEILSKSKYFDPSWARSCPTRIPMLNVALSGELDGGISQGILMIAGDSRTFKTGFLLELASSFQNKHPEGIILFYDSEHGAPLEYFRSRGINMDLILHCPIVSIEQLKMDLAYQLNDITDDDEVMIMIDSIGNLASNKEIDDAVDQNIIVDMTRAKAMNSLFRIVTPHLSLKRIPLTCINHTYGTMEKYSKTVISGGKKSFLSANDIWVITRNLDKEGKEINGFYFNVLIEKSRTCKEQSVIPIHATYENGLDIWSGLFDEAKDAGILIQSGAWYKNIDFMTGELSMNKRKADILGDSEFFRSLIKFEPFKEFLRNKYVLMFGETHKNDEEIIDIAEESINIFGAK